MPDNKFDFSKFDLDSARKATNPDGTPITDDQILDYVAPLIGYDHKTARSKGHKSTEILDYLSTPNRGFGTQRPADAPMPGLHTPEVKPYGLGNTYSTINEIGRQTGNFVKGTIDFLGNLSSQAVLEFNPETGRLENTNPNSLGTMVSAFPEIVKKNFFDPLDTDPDMGLLKRITNTTTAMMGGDPEAGKRLYEETGSIGPSLAAHSTVPVLGIFSGVGAAKRKVPNLATLESTNAASSLIDKSAIRSTFDPQRASGISSMPIHPNADVMTGIATITQPLKQQAMIELGLDPAIFATKDRFIPRGDTMGKVKLGAKFALDVVGQAVDIANRPIEMAMSVFGDRRVASVQSSVLNDLKSAIDNYTNLDKPLAAALQGVYNDVAAKGETVGGLNTLKAHANKEINSLLKASEGKQIAASAQSAYAYKILADSIRSHLYPEIAKLGGPDLGAYGAREAAAIMERDGVASTYYNRVAPQQARAATMDYLTYVVEGSLYKSHVLRRALKLEPMPLGEFNKTFSQGIGRIPENFTPETVQGMAIPSSTGRKMLPAGPDSPFTFEIPGIAQEAIGEITGKPATANKTYVGTTEIPSKQFTPVEPKPPESGTSYYRQRQDLGVAAETIPESVRGVRSPAKVRQDELGSSQSAIPERVFTGPETETVSQWDIQYMNPEEGGAIGAHMTGVTPEPGARFTMRTADPKLAVQAVKKLNKLLENENLDPALRLQYQTAVNNLTTQLRQYATYSSIQPPPSMGVKINPADLGNYSIGGYGKRAGYSAVSTGAVTNTGKQDKKKK